MGEEKRKACLADLVEYQARKELIYKIIIGHWLVTILLGLLSMILEGTLSETGMYIVWTWLLISNILLVIGQKFYDHERINAIIKKYSNDAVVIVNPVTGSSVV